MLRWIFNNFLKEEDDPALPTQKTAKSFVVSSVADCNVVIHWMYYSDIVNGYDFVPPWLIRLQFLACIFGTFSWLVMITDGRFIHWLRAFCILWIYAPISLFRLGLKMSNKFIVGKCLGHVNIGYRWVNQKVAWVENKVLTPLRIIAQQKLPVTSDILLFLGIMVEDIPQLIVAFIIEDRLKYSDPKQGYTSLGMYNLLLTIFDVLHKGAEALDTNSDILNANYLMTRKLKARIRLIIVPRNNKSHQKTE